MELEEVKCSYSGMKEFTIAVLGNPDVSVKPQTARVTEGSDVMFTCSARASTPSVTYSWQKNGEVCCFKFALSDL